MSMYPRQCATRCTEPGHVLDYRCSRKAYVRQDGHWVCWQQMPVVSGRVLSISV